jgi:FkbM family methyltransferase
VRYVFLRESMKLALRRAMSMANLSISRDPAVARLQRALSAMDVDTVLDVGANVGQFAALLRGAGFTGRIISFEPLSSAFEELRRRAARDPNWEVYNVAVGREPGELQINISDNSYSSSILDVTETHLHAAPRSKVVGVETVRVETVEALMSDLGVVPERTLLKVDTQGYESFVLDGAGDLVKRLRCVQLELSFVPLYEGQQLFDTLRSRLEANGLELYSFEPGISDANGRLLQCDGLFVRSDRGDR